MLNLFDINLNILECKYFIVHDISKKINTY